MQKKLHKFFWPNGNLSPLKSDTFKLEAEASKEITRDDFYKLKDQVSDIFKELILESGYEIFLPQSSFDNLVGVN